MDRRVRLGPDADAPSFAGLLGMTASAFPGSSSCWTRDSLHQVTPD
jgi:hypothetical protein